MYAYDMLSLWKHIINSLVSQLWQPKYHDITKSCSVNMDAWYYRIRVAHDTMEFEFMLL